MQRTRIGVIVLILIGLLPVGIVLLRPHAAEASPADTSLPAAPDPGHDWDVVEHHPDSGQLRLRGRVDAAGRRSGEWKAWYPDGQRQWQRHYHEGSWDRSRPWVEYAPDGSVSARGPLEAAAGDRTPSPGAL